MRVHILELADMSPAALGRWRDLAAHPLEPNPFHEPPWLGPAASTLPDGRNAGLLVVEDGDRMLFALPVHGLRHFRGVPVRGIGVWRAGSGLLGTPLVAEDRATDAWIAALRHLRGRRGTPWLVLGHQAREGPVAAARDAALAELGVDRVPYYGFERPVVRRREEPTYLTGRISGRHLKRLRRRRRLLSAELRDDVRTVDHAGDPVALSRAIEGFVRIEAAGWKGRARGAVASLPGHREFFRTMCEAYARQGRLQFWSLGTEDRAAAYQCTVLAGTAVFHCRVTYDERLAGYSPGFQLELDLLEDFHRDSRLELLDSCGNPSTRISAQLYPDRVDIATLLIPLRGPAGRVAARATPLLATAYRRRMRHDVGFFRGQWSRAPGRSVRVPTGGAARPD
jgi:CelD/BcsL family acetyltransferase involved in cellulose biosynthesis